MNDHFLQFSLGCCTFYNLLINCFCRDEPEHKDRYCLTDPVTPVLGLKICLWILEERLQLAMEDQAH
jgi:hypothetical protein